MKKVNVLIGTEVSNKNILLSYWSILYENRINLKKKKIIINFYSKITDNFLKGDVLIISSRFFYKKNIENKDKILLTLENIKNINSNIIWFDLRDSAGTTQFEVLPLVKKYLKGQLYIDKNTYLKPLYGGRYYTNYYHEKYNVIDDESYVSTILDKSYQNKLALSWNIGTLRYDLRFLSLFKKIFYNNFYFWKLYNNDLSKYFDYKDISKRNYRVHAVFNKSFDRKTVAYQRLIAFNKLKNKNNSDLLNNNLTKNNFYKSLQESKIVLSLFGWGEICYRDWESIIFGTPFIKPDMSHIETWPNIYIPNKTYYPVNYNLENLEQVIQLALSSEAKSASMVKLSQNIHKSIRSNNGYEFCKRFEEIIKI